MGVAVRSGTSAAVHHWPSTEYLVRSTKRLLAHRATKTSGLFRLRWLQREQSAPIQRVSGDQLKHNGAHAEALAQVPRRWVKAKESLQEPKEPEEVTPAGFNGGMPHFFRYRSWMGFGVFAIGVISLEKNILTVPKREASSRALRSKQLRRCWKWSPG